jgi:hypothetical protein
MTEAQFSEIALKICLTGLIIYMLWIVYNMGKESKAGRFGMIIMFIALGAGFFSFVVKGVLQYIFTH